MLTTNGRVASLWRNGSGVLKAASRQISSLLLTWQTYWRSNWRLGNCARKCRRHHSSRSLIWVQRLEGCSNRPDAGLCYSCGERDYRLSSRLQSSSTTLFDNICSLPATPATPATPAPSATSATFTSSATSTTTTSATSASLWKGILRHGHVMWWKM